MKTLNLGLAIVILLMANVSYAKKHEVNTDKSSVEWHGKKIGGEHMGLIQIKSGFLEKKGDKIVAGNFIVDMTSITCTDLTNEGYNQKLVGHLKSDDFFGVEKFPTAKFVVTKSAELSGGKATVTGDLTIKGKTESITFDVKQGENAFTTKIEIDRSKFDVRYGSNSFFDNLGDKAINDIFTLDINLMVN